MTNILCGSVLAAITFLGLISSSAAATDIKCDGSSDRKSDAVICDYAILRTQYQTIYDRQALLLSRGLLDPSTLAAWRQDRDNCDSVSCMDAVFARWNGIDASIVIPTPTPPSLAPREEPASTTDLQPASASAQKLAPVEAATPSQPVLAETTKEPAPMQSPASDPVVVRAPSQPTADAVVTTSPPLSVPVKDQDGVLWVLICLIGAAMAASGPRQDRRFKTGYKNNQVPNWKLKAFGVLVVVVGLAVKFL